MAGRTSQDGERRRALAAFLTVAAVVAALDLASKWAAFHYLDWGEALSLVPGCLALRLNENKGAVFGLGQGRRVLFIVFTLVASVGILWVQRRHGRSSKWLNAGLGLLLGGALGNLYDRLFIIGRDGTRGVVRDFIDVYFRDWHWPTFNVADMALCVGCGLIVLCSFRAPKEEAGAKQTK